MTLKSEGITFVREDSKGGAEANLTESYRGRTLVVARRPRARVDAQGRAILLRAPERAGLGADSG